MKAKRVFTAEFRSQKPGVRSEKNFSSGFQAEMLHFI
jgi:hypothetical protein